MMKKTVEPVASFLFQNCRPPFDVLGQEKCRTVEVSKGKRLGAYGQPWKNLLLKVLDECLFIDPADPTSFNKDNTILIDDSPAKGVLNENGNGIFVDSWNRDVHGDDVLLGTLIPWLKRLHNDCPLGCLREFVDAHRIGEPPLTLSSNQADHIVDGMRESARNFGNRFVLPGMNLVIESQRHRKK
jgi:hypothetical protein